MTVSAEPLKPVTLNERETYLLEALEGLLDALPSATTHPAIQLAAPFPSAVVAFLAASEGQS